MENSVIVGNDIKKFQPFTIKCYCSNFNMKVQYVSVNAVIKMFGIDHNVATSICSIELKI